MKILDQNAMQLLRTHKSQSLVTNRALVKALLMITNQRKDANELNRRTKLMISHHKCLRLILVENKSELGKVLDPAVVKCKLTQLEFSNQELENVWKPEYTKSRCLPSEFIGVHQYVLFKRDQR